MFNLNSVNVIFILLILCSLSINVLNSTRITKCVLNPFYNPICGSDYKTYGNKDLLNCHNKHRVRQRAITPIYHRECKPLICPSYFDLLGPWQSLIPVCANNGFTYGNIHQVRCLKDFMPSLKILHEGGCTVYEVRAALGRNFQKKACTESRRYFEKNAICTNRNETYMNPFKALCELPRGLREKIGGVCGCPFQRSCEKALEIQQSLRSAPFNERNRFIVCGSDWHTYRTKYHLECSRRYNSYLYMTHYGHCRKNANPCPERLKYIKSPSPVCGSDDKSYVSYEALICAKFRMNRGLKYVHAGPCIRRT